MDAQPTIAITAPYPEGAIMALSSEWQAVGHLATTIRPSRAFNRAIAQLIEPLASDLSTRIARNVNAAPWIQEVAPLVEVLRLLGRMAPLPAAFVTATSSGKKLFDRAVAHSADLAGASILLGMQEASLQTFERYPGSTNILHEVDAHPRYHNEVLWDVYGKRQARHEAYSARRVERMEAEIDVADRILVPSRIVENKMASNGVHRDKMFRVPYGVSFDNFVPTLSGWTTSDKGRKPKALYVGQIALRKGIPFLIEAARQSGVALDLIGSVVPGKPMPMLPDNVRYLGPVPHGKLVDHLNSADAFVFPSLEDACPFTVLEAAATGLPVIMTRAVGSGELFRDTAVRWVREADAHDLAEALRDIPILTQEERLTRAHGARNGEICHVKSWAEYAAEVYSQLI